MRQHPQQKGLYAPVDEFRASYDPPQQISTDHMQEIMHSPGTMIDLKSPEFSQSPMLMMATPLSQNYIL